MNTHVLTVCALIEIMVDIHSLSHREAFIHTWRPDQSETHHQLLLGLRSKPWQQTCAL